MKTPINILRFIPLSLWIILVYILLTLPGKDFGTMEVSIPNLDKIAHMTLFGGIVFWFGFALLNIDKNRTRCKTIFITVIASIYGVAMEYVQKYWTNHTRDFSYGDMFADLIGAIIAYFLIRWITIKYQSRAPKNNY
ncbi:MAG TPA: VanZ family protein [Arachidicoccus sp.]